MESIMNQIISIDLFLIALTIVYLNILKDKKDNEKLTAEEKIIQHRERKKSDSIFSIFFVILLIGTLIESILFRAKSESLSFDSRSLLILIFIIVLLLSMRIFHKKAEGRLLLTGFIISILMLVLLIVIILGQFNNIGYWALFCYFLSVSFFVVSSMYLVFERTKPK